MKNLKIVVPTLVLLAVLVGTVYALTPPPPPPPPVPQNLGIYDTSIDFLQTNATDQTACRACHQTSGTNISGGYSNTIGGVPTRHHNLVALAVINPLTKAPFGCPDCHPSTPGIGNGILLDRSCTDCHNGTSFFADATLGAHVGNFSRPHHVNTTYDDANIGNPVANRTCNFCHGSFVASYNDGHYKPTYDTSFMITPYATFKITNFSQPDGLGGNKVWGGCQSCHVDNPNALPFPIGENHHNHHKEILGFGLDPSGDFFGGTTPFQNASTPFVNVANICSVCHVIDKTNSTGHDNTWPLFLTLTNSNPTAVGGVETLTDVAEVRNSTIESGDAVEFVSANGSITVNGTGCEKCHDVKSIHNIQFQYVQNGPQGKGHINNNSDCSGCHDSWLPAAGFVPGALVPYLDDVSPSVIAAGTATTLTITGSNFVNDPYTSVVAVDGVTYAPTSITDTQLSVDIPALAAGIHKLQLVKGGDTLSKLSTLTVVPSPTISLVTFAPAKNGQSGTLTITGKGFGARPATNANYYVSVNHAGNQIVSSSISKWTDTRIIAKISNVGSGDQTTVLIVTSGEVRAPIK